MSKQAKYRPSLSAEQISYILQLAKQDYANSAGQKALDVIGILQPFMAKIEVGALSVSHTASLRTGLEVAITYSNQVASYPSSFSSKEAYWLHCYDMYKLGGDVIATMTVAEIQAAKEHMYLNDLMSDEEAAEYEKLDVTKNL